MSDQPKLTVSLKELAEFVVQFPDLMYNLEDSEDSPAEMMSYYFSDRNEFVVSWMAERGLTFDGEMFTYTHWGIHEIDLVHRELHKSSDYIISLAMRLEGDDDYDYSYSQPSIVTEILHEYHTAHRVIE